MITPIEATPVQPLERLGASLCIDLRVKRDDLLPIPGGGNKLRKIARIMDEARAQGCNALVTTGGTQSNHARVTALAAAAQKWPCRLILHGSPDALRRPMGNLLLAMLAGADVVIVRPDGIAAGMAEAMQALRDEGFNPYEVPGGGHTVQGSLAYVDAVREFSGQECDWVPDFIVLPSGTGATQAGLIVGCRRQGWSTHVIGISVARRNPRGTEVVWKAAQEAASHCGVVLDRSVVDFRDAWIGKGYEHVDARVLAVIRDIARQEGVFLDPTYTGKAFTALCDLVREGEIPRGSRVLFWHTGGLLNLLSSPYSERLIWST